LAFEDNVFVNCPFDPGYVDLLRPMLFCILALNFEPRIALERADGGEARIDKIVELINESKFGVHDLSRLKAENAGDYYRLNMPFELGIDFACRMYRGEPWSGKRILILEDERFELKKALSDLSGSDVEAHNNEPVKICSIVRHWLAQALPVNAASPSVLWGQFTEFVAANYQELTAAGWSQADIEDQPIRELIKSMRKWLQKANDA
jgi:hypothetical protein